MNEPLDIAILGTALNTQGFTAKGAISGVGLNTFGMLWPCADIWSPSEDVITTTWSVATPENTEVCSE